MDLLLAAFGAAHRHRQSRARALWPRGHGCAGALRARRTELRTSSCWEKTSARQRSSCSPATRKLDSSPSRWPCLLPMKGAGRYWEVACRMPIPNCSRASAFFPARSTSKRHRHSSTTLLRRKARRCWSSMASTFRQAMMLQALTLTLRLAVIVSVILLALGVPLALLAGVLAAGAGNFLSRRSSRCPSCCRRPCWASTFWSPSARSAPWDAGIRHSPARAGIHV